MRLNAGDKLRVFNGIDGEWLTEIKEINKKSALIEFYKKIDKQISASDLWVLASPIKKESFDIMIEKSAELGASKFMPVICAHTVVHRANEERLQAISIEAAEQCERMDIMTVSPLVELKAVLQGWPSDRKLIFCQERGGAPPIAQKLAGIKKGTPLAVLVGPEGGFSDEETQFIRSQPFVESVSLGPRILRAETALIAALACIGAF